MQPKAALRNGQPAPAQARSGWIMPFVFRTAGPSSQLIWTAVIPHMLAESPMGSENCSTEIAPPTENWNRDTEPYKKPQAPGVFMPALTGKWFAIDRLQSADWGCGVVSKLPLNIGLWWGVGAQAI